MAKVPIACSLTSNDAEVRIGEWRKFFEEHADATDQSEGQLRVRLRPTDESLLAAVDLSERERACCDFFVFAIEIGADARWLRIVVPDEATRILEDFARLLPAALRD